MNTKVFHKISYGLYVVSSRRGEELNGQIANTLFQITSDPPNVAVSINRENLTHEFIRQSGSFSASILVQDAPMTLIGRFGFKSGRDLNKFEDVEYRPGKTGSPIVLANACAYLEAEVFQEADLGTHTVFFARVVAAEILSGGEPMTYAFYHQVKGGKAPKAAPTYIGEAEAPGVSPFAGAYRCTVCGYVYSPEQGDPQAGIAPGTSFADLPEDWVCPVCGVGKDRFEPVA